MRLGNSGFSGASLGVGVVLLVPALLASCAGGAGGSSPLAGLFGGGGTTAAGDQQQPEYGPEFFLKSGYCPPVQVRLGTEALANYERGHEGDPAFIRNQGSIASTARECTTTPPDTMFMRIGVAGRVVAGPAGKAEVVTLPIRVAVVKQSTGAVLFSQVMPAKVTLTPPTLNAEFSQVMDQVSFKVTPQDRDLQVFVGFDEGKADAKGKPAPKPKS